jgi:hypothetical protein
MSKPRLRSAVLALAASLSLGACAYGSGYGHTGVSVGYGSYGGGYGRYGRGYCDPYFNDCAYGGYGYADPWFGWYDNVYYPGVGVFVYDRYGRRFNWADHHRSYWMGRRGYWGSRDWNDRRWERWDGYGGDRRRIRRYRRY